MCVLCMAVHCIGDVHVHSCMYAFVYGPLTDCVFYIHINEKWRDVFWLDYGNGEFVKP